MKQKTHENGSKSTHYNGIFLKHVKKLLFLNDRLKGENLIFE